MTAGVVALILAVVLAASVLNLALGAGWVMAFLTLWWAGRRLRIAGGLALLVAVAGLVAGARGGWLGPLPPVSYGLGEMAWLRDRLGPRPEPRPGAAHPGAAHPGADGAAVDLLARIQRQRREEARYPGPVIERRAAAAVALSRSLRRHRSLAPAQVVAVEQAVNQLALTLTSPEFRDLEGRRARAAEWLGDLETRLDQARHPADLAAVGRALDPAAMAPVSLRAIREDLARVDEATRALVHALGGGEVGLRVVSTVAYDEGPARVVTEDRFEFTVEPPLRMSRLDAGELTRRAAGEGAGGRLTYELGGEVREVRGRADIALPPEATRVVLIDRRTHPVLVHPVRSLLKRIPFQEVELPAGPGPDEEFLVTVVVDTIPGADLLLPVGAPLRRPETLTTPGYALYHVDAPGVVTTADDRDRWTGEPAEAGGARAGRARVASHLELVPATWLLRNRAFAGLRVYLYQPNLATTLAAAGLAALTAVLVRRRPGGAAGSP